MSGGRAVAAVKFCNFIFTILFLPMAHRDELLIGKIRKNFMKLKDLRMNSGKTKVIRYIKLMSS